jgi:hypothetical protein
VARHHWPPARAASMLKHSRGEGRSGPASSHAAPALWLPRPPPGNVRSTCVRVRGFGPTGIDGTRGLAIRRSVPRFSWSAPVVLRFSLQIARFNSEEASSHPVLHVFHQFSTTTISSVIQDTSYTSYRPWGSVGPENEGRTSTLPSFLPYK